MFCGLSNVSFWLHSKEIFKTFEVGTGLAQAQIESELASVGQMNVKKKEMNLLER